MKKSLDPLRLGDDARAPEALSEALRLARRAPDANTVERMSAALGVAVPVAPPPVPPASGLTAAAAGSSSSWLGVAAIVGTVGAGSAWVGLSLPGPSAAPPPVPAPVASTQSVEAPPSPEPERTEAPVVMPSTPAPAANPRRRRAEPEPAAPEAAPAASEAPRVPMPEPTDAASRLREEALLVRQAERQLASDPGRALALTEERRRRFPGGALGQEAEVVAIDALLRLGRRDAASARARSFEARHPGSVHARRIRALLGSTP
ncbi:MAG TPA: hypothetical protein VGK73_05130 [Polyangiaceae bacterium]